MRLRVRVKQLASQGNFAATVTLNCIGCVNVDV